MNFVGAEVEKEDVDVVALGAVREIADLEQGVTIAAFPDVVRQI